MFYVTVKNIPPYICEDEIYNFLNKKMAECGFDGESMLFVEIDEAAGSALVEFTRLTACREVATLDGIVFEGYNLQIKLGKGPKDVNDELYECENKEKGWSPMFFTSAGTSYCKERRPSHENDGYGSVISDDTEWVPTSVELAALAKVKKGLRSTSSAVNGWDDSATKALVKELIKRKNLIIGRKKMPVNFWRDISNALWLANLNFSPDSCRKRKKTLDAFFDKAHKSNGSLGQFKWMFYNDMATLTGMGFATGVPTNTACAGNIPQQNSILDEDLTANEVSVAAIHEDQNAEDENPKKDLVLTLIDLYAERKTRIDQPQKDGNERVTIYREIANEVAIKCSVVLTWQEVKAKIEKILREFKYYFDLSKTSGAGAIKWPYYDTLLQLLGDGVNMTPLVAASVGRSTTYKRKALEEKDTEELDQNKENRSNSRLSSKFPRSYSPQETPVSSKGNRPRGWGNVRSPLGNMLDNNVQFHNILIDQFTIANTQMARRTDLFEKIYLKTYGSE